MIERRSAVALVAGQDGSESRSAVTVHGVAVPYFEDSQPLPFIEQFAPDAFQFQIDSGFDDVTGQFQHDQTFVVASVRSATMSIEDGAMGLRYSMRIPASLPYVAEMVASGVTAGASVGFQCIRDEWSVDATTGNPRRLVTEAELHEISIVANPAYRAATAVTMGGFGRSRRRVSEQRAGKMISKANMARLRAAHDALAESLGQLRDLMDTALFETPPEGGFDPDEGMPEQDSIPSGLSEAPEGSKIGSAASGGRSLWSTTTLDAARQLRRRLGAQAAADRLEREKQVLRHRSRLARDELEIARRHA
jgi:HK97 family phage prohead protease